MDAWVGPMDGEGRQRSLIKRSALSYILLDGQLRDGVWRIGLPDWFDLCGQSGFVLVH